MSGKYLAREVLACFRNPVSLTQAYSKETSISNNFPALIRGEEARPGGKICSPGTKISILRCQSGTRLYRVSLSLEEWEEIAECLNKTFDRRYLSPDVEEDVPEIEEEVRDVLDSPIPIDEVEEEAIAESKGTDLEELKLRCEMMRLRLEIEKEWTKRKEIDLQLYHPFPDEDRQLELRIQH